MQIILKHKKKKDIVVNGEKEIPQIIEKCRKIVMNLFLPNDKGTDFFLIKKLHLKLSFIELKPVYI